MSTSSRPFTLNPTLFNQTLYSRLLTLWFSDLPSTAKNPTPAHLSRWFGRGASADAKRDFDAQCAAIALPALESIAADKFVLPELKEDGGDRGWIARPFLGEFGATDPSAPAEDDGNTGNESKKFSDARNALALILLLDQMPRNIFRTRQSIIYAHYD
ncbi:MAG: hypothetical protein Q9188_003909, partial [Gyalolechia gomerana]